jgi:hypothetical protein
MKHGPEVCIHESNLGRRSTVCGTTRRKSVDKCRQVLGSAGALWLAESLAQPEGLHSFLTVYIGSNLCRPQATYVNIGFGQPAAGASGYQILTRWFSSSQRASESCTSKAA